MAAALSLFGTTVYETTVTYDLSIVPLFVLMGSVASRSGLSRELHAAFNAWFGAFRGGLNMSPMAVMAVILLMYLVMGEFLDALAMILLTVPIFFPIVINLGFDPVWFGVIVVMVVEFGLITPPIGMNVFVIKGMAPKVSLSSIYIGVMPFVVAQILLIIAVFLIPDIALWLPESANSFR